MKLARRLDPFRHFRFELFGRSLSARVLWLTVSIIMLVEIAVLMPNLGRERQAWLVAHVTQARLAGYSAAQSPDGMLDPATTQTLLTLSDTESITLTEPGQVIVLAPPTALPPADETLALAGETLLESTGRSDLSVLGFGPQQLDITTTDPTQPQTTLVVRINGGEMAAYLRDYAIHIATLSVIIALVTGLLVFAVLDRLLVRPMRILTASIVGFRNDPEHDSQSDLVWLAQRRDDEMSGAARELKVMQDDMRAALWRNARLAAVGTAVAKISHDLRNILSSALLVADRLQETSDPIAKRAAQTLIPAVERAAQFVTRTVDFAREGPPPITRTAVFVSELIDEAAQIVRPDDTGVRIDNQVPANLVLALDRDHIYRVLVNLMRNAAEAGADIISLSVESKAGTTRLRVADNGPGLPLRVQDNLFKPFTGSGRHGGTGLGLAIARDLIRAHGGDLALAQTGPRGTIFVMELAVSEAGSTLPQDYNKPLSELLPPPAAVPPPAPAPAPHIPSIFTPAPLPKPVRLRRQKPAAQSEARTAPKPARARAKQAPNPEPPKPAEPPVHVDLALLPESGQQVH